MSKPCQHCRADAREPCFTESHERKSDDLPEGIEVPCAECGAAPGCWCRGRPLRREKSCHDIRVLAYFRVAHLL